MNKENEKKDKNKEAVKQEKPKEITFNDIIKDADKAFIVTEKNGVSQVIVLKGINYVNEIKAMLLDLLKGYDNRAILRKLDLIVSKITANEVKKEEVKKGDKQNEVKK